jgi:hypothetical protein
VVQLDYTWIYEIEQNPPEIEVQMRNFYQSLSEKDRRRYAAIERRKWMRAASEAGSERCITSGASKKLARFDLPTPDRPRQAE